MNDYTTAAYLVFIIICLAGVIVITGISILDDYLQAKEELKATQLPEDDYEFYPNGSLGD